MHYHIFPTAQQAVEKLAQELLAYSQQNRAVHISLSGGSTPKLWFKRLAQSPYNQQIQWQNLHFWWGDERMVSPGSPESNYGEVQSLLFDHIAIPSENIHRIRGENDRQQELERFRAELEQFIDHGQFDWIILGMGEDGHTASLFPNQTDFADQNWVVAATHPETGQWRISKTAHLIQQAKRVTYLVTGEAKAPVLQQIQAGEAAALAYPAARIKAQNGNTDWYLDQAAASLLK